MDEGYIVERTVRYGRRKLDVKEMKKTTTEK